MLKTILFDLDGTLTDSGEGIMKSTIYTLTHYGIEAPPEAQLRTVVGPPLTESFARFGVPQDKLTEAVEIYRSRYIPIGRFENHPYPGIEVLLENLQRSGHKLYIRRYVLHSDLHNIFDLMVLLINRLFLQSLR